MKPDVTINGVSMLSLGWLRETVNFPTPQSQNETLTVPGRSAPIRFSAALGRVAYQPRSFDMTFTMLGDRADYDTLVLVLSCTDGDAYLYHVVETTVSASGSRTVTLQNDYMPVVPVIQTTAETTLRWAVDGESFNKTVSAGTWEIPELELRHGENTVSVAGEGTTTFTYRQGRL